ncbi:MAG: Ig-like domain-containing protein [Aeriscardovia sp.]|nr:Ig-like domain-containing protein [Aeriscardovia sp.]MBP3211494.1 Ig-like domain-containing protein [Prevotella sp.]
MIKQLRYLCTLLLMAVVSVAWGEESVTFTFSDLATTNSWENGTAYTTVEISPITLSAVGGGNNGKYYVSDKSWRMYNGGTVNITASEGYEITAVSSTPSKNFTISNGSATLSCTETIKFTSITVTYSAASSTAIETTTTINDTNLTNTDVYNSTSAGSLSASVSSASGSQIEGATVTWSSSDENVATINDAGVVTLVAAGSTTITASYAGVEGTYKPSYGTYELTVTDSTPFSGGDVTFDATTDKGTSPLVKNGITFECTNGILNNGSEYRLYKGSVTTFSVSEGAITQIAFTGKSGYAASNFTEQTGWTTDGNNGTWTGNAQSVSFTASSAQVRATKIVVTVDLSATPDPVISTSDVNIAYNATSGEIEYTIGNPIAGTSLSASTDAAWLTLGTVGNAAIPFTCSANNGTESRAATVTLTYGAVTKDVTVTQAAPPVSYKTIPALFNAATDTNTDVYVTFNNWVVTGVNGSQLFVSDGTNGFIVYQKDHGFVVGNVLSGTVSCSLVLYNGSAELTGLTSQTEGLEVNTGGSVDIADVPLADLTGVNTGALVSYKNLTCNVTTTTSGDNTYTNYDLTDGTTTIRAHSSLYDFTVTPDFEDGKQYNVTGVFVLNNQAKRILPRSVEDIEEVKDDRAAAEIAFNPETLTITQGDTDYTTPEFVNPNKINLEDITFTSTNENVADWDDTGLVFGTETGTATITATFEGNVTYKPATATLVVTVKKDLGFVEVVEGNGIYEKITSSNKLEAGHRYLVVYEVVDSKNTPTGDAEILNDVDNSKSYGLFATGSITNNRIDNTAVQAKPVVLQEAGDGNWFLMIDDDFLYVNTDGNYLNKSDDYTTNGIAWNIDFDADHLIQNTYLAARFLMMNKGANPHRFSCYKGTQQDVVLYKELQENPVLIGDVNKDGSVTIADVTALVNILLNKDTTAYDLNAADVDRANGITVADVEELVNIILEKTN